jgi:hypothetical protein
MVSDLLRREGVKPAKRLPYLKPVASDTTGRRHEGADFRGDDDAPTVQLSVAELLRRESDKPEHTRSGKRTTITIAAGVAALFGLAAVAFGAIGSHDGSGLTAADGQGDLTTGPSPNTATVSSQPDLLTSGNGLALGATPVTDTATSGPAAQQGKADKTKAAPVNAQSNRMAGQGGNQSNGAPAAGTTTQDTPTVTNTPTSPSTTTPTTTTPETSTPTPTPTTGNSGTNNQSPTPTTPTTTNTDLLGSVTGLADGVITGLLGH